MLTFIHEKFHEHFMLRSFGTQYPVHSADKIIISLSARRGVPR